MSSLAKAVCTLIVVVALLVFGCYYLSGHTRLFDWSIRVPLPSVPALLTGHGVHAQLPQESERVIGRPTLTPTFINQVLARAGSPAQGTGQALYTLSQQYHINDAYALAIFKHESDYGRFGIARITFSLGNIKCSPGYQCLNGYRAYHSWQEGYADWYHVIATVYIAHGFTTIPQIIPVYAPASDGNNVRSYIADIEQSVTGWQQGKL